jgi:hypothetical protein
MPIAKTSKKKNSFPKIFRAQIKAGALILDLEEDVRIMTKEKKIHCKSL